MAASSKRHDITAVFNAQVSEEPRVVLTHLEELLKVQPTVVVRIGAFEYGRGKSFGKVLALVLFNHPRQLFDLQVSIPVCVILK
jgi:hypothetical protein